MLGLNNACISGTSATADCSDCPCNTPCANPEFYFLYGDVTSVVDNGDGTMTLEVASTAAPDTTQAIHWGDVPESGSTACCDIVSFVVTDPAGGSTPGWGVRDCD